MHHDALVNRLLVYQRERSFVTLFGKNSFRRLVVNHIETVGEHIATHTFRYLKSIILSLIR